MIEIEGYGIKIIRKPIRHIYFKVNPKTKTIFISAPKQISSDQLNQVILSKKPWLLKQVSKKIARKTDIKDDVLGDSSIMFMGQKYPIKITYQTGQPFIDKNGDSHFSLYLKPGSTLIDIQHLINTWYRKELDKRISLIIEKWQPVMGVQIKEFKTKKMKTRWGSCNITARRIWLNFHLVKLDHEFLEYVVVHELVHLLEKRHNARFKNFMTQFIPHWPDLKKQLNEYSL